MSFLKIKTNILSIVSMIVINDLIGLPLSASMANSLVFLVLGHPFSSLQGPWLWVFPQISRLLLFPRSIFPWRFIYSVKLSYLRWFFPDISIPLVSVKCLEVLHKFSSTLTLIENFTMRTHSHQKVLLTRKCHRNQMDVSTQFPHCHLRTDLVCQDSLFSTGSTLLVMDIKWKLLDKNSALRLCF